MLPPKVLACSGRTHDRAGDLVEKIKGVIYENCDQLPLVAVLGALEIVKIEFFREQTE